MNQRKTGEAPGPKTLFARRKAFWAPNLEPNPLHSGWAVARVPTPGPKTISRGESNFGHPAWDPTLQQGPKLRAQNVFRDTRSNLGTQLGPRTPQCGGMRPGFGLVAFKTASGSNPRARLNSWQYSVNSWHYSNNLSLLGELVAGGPGLGPGGVGGLRQPQGPGRAPPAIS